MLPLAPSLPAQLKEGAAPGSVSGWRPSKGLMLQVSDMSAWGDVSKDVSKAAPLTFYKLPL